MKSNWTIKSTSSQLFVIIIHIIIVIIAFAGESIFINCSKIQIEEYCDGPICEYLYWKLDQDEVDTEKTFSKKLIYFRNSIIPKIPIELFHVYPDLKQLSMSGVYIEELPENMESESLEFLYLSNNKIKVIESNAFKSLPNLRYLWLSGNQIENINSFAFDNMDNLLFLELSDNEITELSDTLFKNMPKLTSLFLSKNKIETLHNGVFDNNANLYQLSIDNNNLMTIDDNIFKEAKHINTLDISFNPIRTLNLIDVNMERLISDSTNLIKINIGGTIKQLDFSKTPIKKIELSEPDNLETLMLNECYIRDLSFVEPFGKLRFLNISSNPFMKLNVQSFQKLKYLQFLSIEDCDLNQIDVEIFSSLKDLKNLDISNNRLKEINLDVFKHMNNLKFIVIHGNQWSCCSLKPLIRWLKSRSIDFQQEPKIEQAEGVYLNGINCVV